MRTSIITAKGDALLQRRIRAGLNKSDLAEMAHIPHSSILRAEQGLGVSPKTAVALCNALDLPFDDLFTIETPAPASGKEVQSGS